MKQLINRTIVIKLATLCFITVLATQTATAGDGGNSGKNLIFPPNASLHGKNLSEWMGAYWSWFYTGADPAEGAVDGVTLMPLPAAEQVGGSWTPADPAVLRGTINVTLDARTPFVLPAFAWVRERYVDGSIDPVMAPEVALSAARPLMTIDGETVLSDENEASYFGSLTFDPEIVYGAPSSYNSVAALDYLGVGVIVKPLGPGVHTIRLVEPIIIPAGAYAGLPDGLGQVYDNTWVITVTK